MQQTLKNHTSLSNAEESSAFSLAKDVKDFIFGNAPKISLAMAALLTTFSAAHAADPYGRTLVTATCPGTATTVFNLAVASNFYGDGSFVNNASAIGDLINAFETANSGYCIRVTDWGATATLESHIINGNSGSSVAGVYLGGVDLFFAADYTTPLDLEENHPALVTGGPAPYAEGFVAFLSGKSTYNAAAGYNPTSGSFSTFTNIAIASPTSAPYGKASKELLYNLFGTPNGNITSTHYVTTYTNITAPLTAIQGGTVTAGFVALSAICLNGVYPSPTSIATLPSYVPSAFVYLPVTATLNSTGGTGKNVYSPLLQAAIQIVRTGGTSPQDFLDYATDFTTAYPASGGNGAVSASAAVTNLGKYCYNVPYQAPL